MKAPDRPKLPGEVFVYWMWDRDRWVLQTAFDLEDIAEVGVDRFVGRCVLTEVMTITARVHLSKGPFAPGKKGRGK